MNLLMVCALFWAASCAHDPQATYSHLPLGWHPEEYYPNDVSGWGPEDFCNGDVLYEGSPPSCMEVQWCWEQGQRLGKPHLATAHDFETCGEAHGWDTISELLAHCTKNPKNVECQP